MTKQLPPAAPEPFIAWSYAHDYNAFSPVFSQSCEKHLTATQSRLSEILGPPAIDGIILCDQMARGMAVADLLTRNGQTLPATCSGATCDSHFNEDDLCRATNDHSMLDQIHAGSRGMLLRPAQNKVRRFILLRQSEAAHMHPTGFRKNPDLGLAAVGLLAHELGHAKDYSEGRPGLPSLEETQAQVPPARAEAIHTIADMALAEYVATRAECTAQTVLHGGCSANLTDRAAQMAQKRLKAPSLEMTAPEGSDEDRQHRMDLSTAGYFVGTLAAYVHASAPVMGKDGLPSGKTTASQVQDNMPKTSMLAGILERAAPALERAATAPDATSRKRLVTSLDEAFISARDATRDREAPRRRDTSFGDWFDEL